jgi:hypothetical protein
VEIQRKILGRMDKIVLLMTLGDPYRQPKIFRAKLIRKSACFVVPVKGKETDLNAKQRLCGWLG